MSKKRIRLEFTAITDGQATEWVLDKKLLTLRLLLKANLGMEAVHIFNGWLAETGENPNYICGPRPKRKAR